MHPWVNGGNSSSSDDSFVSSTWFPPICFTWFKNYHHPHDMHCSSACLLQQQPCPRLLRLLFMPDHQNSTRFFSHLLIPYASLRLTNACRPNVTHKAATTHHYCRRHASQENLKLITTSPDMFIIYLLFIYMNFENGLVVFNTWAESFFYMTWIAERKQTVFHSCQNSWPFKKGEMRGESF